MVAPLDADQAYERCRAATVTQAWNTVAPVVRTRVGNAILVRPSTVIEQVHQFDLPGLEPRGAIAADLRLGAQPLRVVGVQELAEHPRTVEKEPGHRRRPNGARCTPARAKRSGISGIRARALAKPQQPLHRRQNRHCNHKIPWSIFP